MVSALPIPSQWGMHSSSVASLMVLNINHLVKVVLPVCKLKFTMFMSLHSIPSKTVTVSSLYLMQNKRY